MKATFSALASLATCFALCVASPAAASHADAETSELIRECKQVRGAGHIGAFGPASAHLDLKVDLTVAGGEHEMLSWRETGPGGVLRGAGYGFVPEAVTCEAFTGGFLFRAGGTAHIRLSARDTREAGEELVVEERLGSTTVEVGGRAPASPGPLPALVLPASRWGPAVSLEGPSGTLNHNSLRAF